ncbi:hypothetical protein E3N88_12019 [Mikania micrantha]|uniref:Uncharacterized protein n=1 Tax=Mikania micrantha TaxID=192012 RepID=A0A5N6P4B7_9ASTR|nr:hypothetical protein E3N88_12019 [Mikania micrantha]
MAMHVDYDDAKVLRWKEASRGDSKGRRALDEENGTISRHLPKGDYACSLASRFRLENSRIGFCTIRGPAEQNPQGTLLFPRSYKVITFAVMDELALMANLNHRIQNLLLTKTETVNSKKAPKLLSLDDYPR